jgi:hypothetical protein
MASIKMIKLADTFTDFLTPPFRIGLQVMSQMRRQKRGTFFEHKSNKV